MSESDNLQDPLLEQLSAGSVSTTTSDQISKKRKREASRSNQETGKRLPKKSSATTKKQKFSEDDDFDIEAGINCAFSNMNSQLVADYLGQRTRKHESELSSVELEDRHIPGEDSSSANQGRG